MTRKSPDPNPDQSTSQPTKQPTGPTAIQAAPPAEPLPDKQSKKNQKKQKLTNKQKKLVKHVLEGHSKAQSAIKAGYSALSAREIAQRTLTLPHVQESMTAIMTRAGLTDEAIADKINQLCHAKKTLYFADKGIVTDSREVEDHAVQRSSIELAAKIKGHLVDRSVNVNVNVDCSPVDLSRWSNHGKVEQESQEPVDNCIDIDPGDS